jgi:hypothetical protein
MIQEQWLRPSTICFLTITESLNLHQVGREDAVSFLKATFPGIKIIPSTESEMKSIIHTLKSKNSSVMMK